MERIGLAGAALISAALLGASAPSVGPEVDNRLVSARSVSANALSEARLSDVNGRATGAIERVYLDADGNIDALRVEWRAGLTEDAVTLDQPIERFSYDPVMNVLAADAAFVTIQRWAAEDHQRRDAALGVSLLGVGSGMLNGANVEAPDGETLGRIVQVLENEEGIAETLIYVSRSGWLFQRKSRHAASVEGARWFANDRTVTLPTRVEI